MLLVQRTGWGKSAVYFIASRLLRDRGAGPTLLVSPLLALMRNQIEAAERMGVRAVTINSANEEEWADVRRRLDDGTVDILLISPERLANEQFRRDVLPEVGRRSGLLVIDEAHCISDWGHDFRPDYRRIVRILDLLPAGVPVLCCTATANDRVVGDVVTQLGSDLAPVRGPLGREGLRLHVLDMPLPGRAAGLARARRSRRSPAPGIVYCLTIADTYRVAEWLKLNGIAAVAYSGETENEDRLAIEQALLDNELKVVVATSALGMGFDKPDLAFVIHYQAPGSPIAYYQQVGRAGRRLDESWGILLRGAEDADIQDYFIRSAFPPPDKAEHGREAARGAVRPGHQERAARAGQRAARPARPAAQDPRGRRRHRARRQRLAAHPAPLDLRRRPGRGGHRAAPGRAGPDERLRRHARPAGRSSSAASSTTPTPSRAGMCDRCTGTEPRHRPSTPRSCSGPSSSCGRRSSPSSPASGCRSRARSRPTADPRPGGRCRSGATAAGAASSARAQRDTAASTTSSSTRRPTLIPSAGGPTRRPTWVTYVPSLRRPELVADLRAAARRRASACPARMSCGKVRETQPQKEHAEQRPAARQRR